MLIETVNGIVYKVHFKNCAIYINSTAGVFFSKDMGIVIDKVYTLKDFGQVYFTSREIAEKALESFKDDLIRYFTSK